MSSKKRIRFFKTIGFKITLWYSLSVLIILLIAGSFLYLRLKHKLMKEVDRILLDESVVILQEILTDNSTQDDLKAVLEKKASVKRHHKMSARLLDIKENMFVTSTNFFAPNSRIYKGPIAKAKKGEYTLETIRFKGVHFPYRLLTKPVHRGGTLKYVIQIAIYMKPTYNALEDIKENFIMLMPVLIIFSVVGGWLVARKSLAPIENINETTRKITASNLSLRLKRSNTGDELDVLAGTINFMLNRLEGSFKKFIQFTSDVSHELRTPVTTLKIGTEIILSEERTAREYRELHENNLKELEEMTRMINDLLILLRSDSGVESLLVKPFNLGKIIEELHNTFCMISETKKINLSINEIPHVQINGDESLLRRVFSNLLDNAIKYTLPGGNISLSLKEVANKVLVSIEDTGIGISEGNQEKIFDRFFCADPSRSRETGGVGLGLSICRNIVELHRGKIEVKSRIDTGSTFIVTLPK